MSESADARRPRLGLIGLGDYFSYAYRARLAAPDAPFRIVAACQRRRSILEAAAVELGQPELYTAWEVLLAQPDLDAVLISTPHHLHGAQVRAALERGLHVLVDKPLCLDATEAESLVRLARERQRVLAVAYNYHTWPHFQAARQVIREGRLGRVTSVACLGTARAEGSPILDPVSWYHHVEQAGGGSLVSGGTHRLMAVFWLTGFPPATISALLSGPRPGFDTQAGLLVELSGGAPAVVLNEAQGPQWRLEVSIFGERGAVLIRNHDLIVLDADGAPVAVDLPAATDALADFHAAIVDGKPLLTTPADAYWAVAATQAAYAAASSHQPCVVRPLMES